MLGTPLAGAGFEVLDVAEDHGQQCARTFAPTRPGDVDLADAAHAVLIEPTPDGVSSFTSARERRQLVEEPRAVDLFQKGDYVGMRSNHVRHIEQRESHFRRDVVRNGLRQGVGGVLLAQPVLQFLIEPRRGLDRGHEHPMTLPIEQNPPQLLNVRLNELEQRGSRPRRNLALERGDGVAAVRDQLIDDRWIGLDGWRRHCAGRHRHDDVIGKRWNEVGAIENALQRIAD